MNMRAVYSVIEVATGKIVDISLLKIPAMPTQLKIR
jgi:hypothetical protein